ncbi:MAG TPA: SDR family oxidoreductase [Acidimicrobiales bacterium]|jgi:NAD(P)-dependent dehydrogenase (short-subunit alcohol dehydrogenase family)|nr:SDR family oxidoreductase [Acidimicrobiales bacterium]
MADGNERAVLTTGANSGIGLVTVIELARRGFHSIGSVRSEEKADIVHKAAADAGVEVHTVLLDVNDAEECERAVSGLRLYGLVNNAGYGVNGAVEDVDDEEAHQLFETMVHAPMRLARLAAPQMRAQGKGRIVNVSSVLGTVTAPFAGHYAGAKHALEALSDALRIELARDGIDVVLVEPGGFKTAIWEEFERDIQKRDANGSRFTNAYRRALWGQKLIEPLMGNPQQCAKVIASALESRFPRSRYMVGLDAQMMRFASQVTPTFVRDRVLRLGFGL